jgi:hypothetical protein
MNAIKKYNQYLAKILIIFLVVISFVPVYAQTEDTAPVDVSETQKTISADTLVQTEDPSSLLETAPLPQETISADTLVQTQDPNTLAVDVATSSGEQIDNKTPVLDTVDTSISLDAVSTTPTDTTSIVAEKDSTDETPIEPIVLDQTMPEEISPEIIAEIPTSDIIPKESFKFSIHNERIETKSVPDWKVREEKKDDKGKIINNTTFSNDASSVVLSSMSGVPVISGSCSMAYYVILLYRNQTDYDKDPASYIINKAYPCVGNIYSFEVKDLPESILNGTYYLLVGEMGETGSWVPTTSLVPIDISH